MILVTGAAGLVGKELIIQLLRKGRPVKALVHRQSIGIHHALLTEVKGDILDIVQMDEIMNGVSEVYHCAGIISFDPSRLRQMFSVNVEGTANVVNAALQAGVRKLVHVSSVSALQRLNEEKPVDETMLWTPGTPGSRYGKTKFLAEMEVWRGIAEGLDAAVVNPSIILGTGDYHEGSTRLFRRVYDGLNWYTEGSTGFVDVQDVAAAMIMIMDSEVTGERFVINAANAGFREVFDLMADAFGKKRPQTKAPSWLSSLFWRMESLRCRLTGSVPLITRETAVSAHAKVQFDNSKLLRFFPSFAYITIEQSVHKYCGFLKKEWS